MTPHLASPVPRLLLDWYDRHAADLPWRQRRDVYGIWLAEVMLQQTQVNTVIPYYRRFLQKYPDIQALAATALDEVLKDWEGLGYYSRARSLHRAARQVVEQHGGRFPRSVEELQNLPGVGRYTAGAIASMAYGLPAPVLDGNVIRVFARLLDLPDDVTRPAVQARLWGMAEELLPDERPGDYNQALMELGRTICRPRAPRCTECPLHEHCAARAAGTQALRPVKRKKAPTPHYDVAAGLIRDTEGRLLIAKRPEEGLLGGLWEFPGGKCEQGETLPQALARELREELAIEVAVGELFIRVKHAFTHFRITLHAYECRYLGALPPYTEPQALQVQDWAWVSEDELARYSFGRADRAVIAALQEHGGRLL